MDDAKTTIAIRAFMVTAFVGSERGLVYAFAGVGLTHDDCFSNPCTMSNSACSQLQPRALDELASVCGDRFGIDASPLKGCGMPPSP